MLESAERKIMEAFEKSEILHKIAIIFVLLSILSSPIAAFTETSWAAEKSESPVRIKANTVKKIDLNGGKKERVKLKIVKKNKSGDVYYQSKIYINGKLKKTLPVDSYFQPYKWKLYYIDIDKSDRYKELVIIRDFDLTIKKNTSSNEMIFFRYTKGKLKAAKAISGQGYSFCETSKVSNGTAKTIFVKCLVGKNMKVTENREFSWRSYSAAKKVFTTVNLYIDEEMKIWNKDWMDDEENPQEEM